MIRRVVILCIILNLTVFMAVGEINVSGVVVDKECDEPLAGASVIIKGADGKIRKFASSKEDGRFSMSITSLGGCRLEVSMMGFARKSLPLDSVSFPLTVYMDPGVTLLKEVMVKADRIRENGDTITYNVGSFAQSQDRTIGDVLRRMPGISVERSGKIQYQGEDINKFYIEGSDLLGGKYGIATDGISREDVGAVEVMENHQPMQVLAGMSFSDKAAINLKLKNRAKAAWTFHGDAGGGHSWTVPGGAVWDGELFAMAVMSGFQNITTFKTNNIGENLSARSSDFFASRRGTDLRPYVGVSSPRVPNLGERRTLFNRSALVSTNSLWKTGHGEFKAWIDYSFNRVTADAANITTYYLSEPGANCIGINDGTRVVTENISGVERSHSLSGRFVYESNQKTAFMNNTLQTNIDWDDVRLGITGSLPNGQSASLPDYYVGNDFKLVKRFKGFSRNGLGQAKNHLVTFVSKNEWESLPQTLSVSRGEEFMRQYIKDHAFYTHESVAYAFSVKGMTISLEGGIKGYLRTLDTELPDMPSEIPGMTENVVNTNYLTVYAAPKFEYWVRRVNISLNAPVSFARYIFDKAVADRDEMYFSPSLSMNWKPNNRFSIGIKGGTGRSPMNLDMIQPGFIMTNYRSFRQGVNDFYSSTSQNVSASLSYRHTRRGLFANAFVIRSWSHTPYTMAQQLYGDYVVYSYSSAKSDGGMFMAGGNIGKTLDFMRGSANLNGSFNRNESHLLSENQSVGSVGTSWSVGAKISGAPLRWLGFDYRFDFSSVRLSMNDANASWLGSVENELLLNIMPHRKWEWHIGGEHYRNEITADEFKDVFLLDTKIVFRLDRRIDLSAALTNIFNQRTYNYTSYNQLNSFESRRWLRGRELLISISLRK